MPVSHSTPPVGGSPDTTLPVTVEEVEFQDGESLPKVTEPQSPVSSGPAGQSQGRVAGVDTPRKGQSSCAIQS